MTCWLHAPFHSFFATPPPFHSSSPFTATEARNGYVRASDDDEAEESLYEEIKVPPTRLCCDFTSLQLV